MPTPPLVDAIVFVPGLLGSELADSEGAVVWGGRRTMSRAAHARTYDHLRVNDDDLAGTPSLHPTGLITRTAVFPHLGAQVPHTELLRAVTDAALDPRAVLAFAYDWRLSVDHNARLLHEAAGSHLDQWISTLGNLRSQGDALGDIELDAVRVSFIAHSLGALIARAACAAPDLALRTRRIVALGAPEHGIARVVDVLSPQAARSAEDEVGAQALAATSPAFYDLLPKQACVPESGTWRRLTTTDLAGMGAHAHLVDAAFKGTTTVADSGSPVPTVHLTGFTIPTPWSIQQTDDGWVSSTHGVDAHVVYGDGLVAHESTLFGEPTVPQLATHEDLAATARHALVAVQALSGITKLPWVPPRRNIGIIAPTTASPGLVRVRVCLPDGRLSRRDNIRVTSRHEYQAGKWYQPVTWTGDIPRDGCLTFSASLRPGAYRVTAHTDGHVAVSSTVAVLSRN